MSLQLQEKVSTVDYGTQTVGLSEVELQKKSKELNAKEKSLNKKECELSQVNSQLTVAKSKIILLEKEISDLHKENDLLKSNLLLAQPGQITPEIGKTIQTVTQTWIETVQVKLRNFGLSFFG